MLEKIIYILGAAFLFYVGYYLITSIGIFKKRKKVKKLDFNFLS